MEKQKLGYKDCFKIKKKLRELYGNNIPVDKIMFQLLDYLTLNYDLTYAPSQYVLHDVEEILSIPINGIAFSSIPQDVHPNVITKLKNTRDYFQKLSQRWIKDFEEYIENIREKRIAEIRYKGLPPQIIKRIYWVDQRMYATNDKIVGSEIIIHYTDNRILGYSNIKSPANYLKGIIFKSYYFEKKEDDLTKGDFSKLCQILKNKIYHIYCRDNNKGERYYEEIWNRKTKTSLPYKIIDNNFYRSAYRDYLNFFLDNLSFACLYLSLHYPFEKSFILENWEYLNLGCIYYSSFDGYGSPKYSSFGLSYNKNIQWDDELREKYKTVYIDEKTFNIVIKEDVPFDNQEYYLNYRIPLSIKSEITAYNKTLTNVHSWILRDKVSKKSLLSKKRLSKLYNWLNIDNLKKLINENSTDVLLSYSIWFNTLQPLVDDNFRDAIFEKLKESKLYRNRYKIDLDGYYIYGKYAFEDYREIDEFWDSI